MGNDLHYFVNSNSCEGFYSFFRSNFGKLQTVLHLEDYPNEILQTVVNRILETADDNGCKMEVVHNCLDNTVEGIILPQFRTAVVNIPAYIDYGYAISKLLDDDAVEQTRHHLLQSHQFFKDAKEIHDQWEKIYIQNTDYSALNAYTKEQISILMDGKKQERRGEAVHRFFGAATEDGAVGWIDNLTGQIGKRYLIKGRPGTGKSTFLKKLSDEAVASGFDVEIYHCAFDPGSLDMVAIRELDFCVFDSTAPHEYFPERETDAVLDFYAAAVREDTDTRYAETLQEFQQRYKEKMEQARLEIAAANEIRLERESLLQREVNHNKAEHAVEKILQKLFLKK